MVYHNLHYILIVGIISPCYSMFFQFSMTSPLTPPFGDFPTSPKILNIFPFSWFSLLSLSLSLFIATFLSLYAGLDFTCFSICVDHFHDFPWFSHLNMVIFDISRPTITSQGTAVCSVLAQQGLKFQATAQENTWNETWKTIARASKYFMVINK